MPRGLKMQVQTSNCDILLSLTYHVTDNILKNYFAFPGIPRQYTDISLCTDVVNSEQSIPVRLR